MAEQQNPAQMVAKQQSLDAAAQYKDAWSQAPEAGVGQFSQPTSGPFAQSGTGLTTQAATPAVPGAPAAPAAPAPVAAVQTLATKAVDAMGTNTKTINALPELAGGAVTNDTPDPTDATTANIRDTPFVGSSNAEGDVGRQETRPERLAIDDTMSADEQYRRQWINETNGYYGVDVAKVAPPAAAPAPVEAPAAPPAPIEYGISYNGPTDASDGSASIYDVATGQAVKDFDGEAGNALYRRMGGVGTINSDQLKEYTGWAAPVATPEPQAKKETA